MDSAVAAIAEWMPAQRWYGGKGHAPRLRRIGEWELPSAESGSACGRCCSWMTRRNRPCSTRFPSWNARRPRGGIRSPHRGPRDGTHLYDGPHDAAFTDVLLDLIVHERRAVAHGATAVGHYSGAPDAARPGPHVPASVLGGEQSNTSIIYRPDGAAPLICKVFRQLHHGDNPDVTLQTALAASGSPHVPPSVGDVVGEWDDVGRPDGRARGHLAFAQEFLRASRTPGGWHSSPPPAAATSRRRTRPRVAVAEVHRSLGGAFPRERASAELIAAIDEAWQRRLTIGVAEVPALEPHRAAIAEYYARATQGAWPQLQRIHGDLHLGQVILSPERGWLLLDFEGEPMRPMAERSPSRPAGARRGGHAALVRLRRGRDRDRAPRARAEARTWAASARQAFIDGYIAASGTDLSKYRDLLAAFELDKAVYEAIYETRNRPTGRRSRFARSRSCGRRTIAGVGAVAGKAQGQTRSSPIVPSSAARRSASAESMASSFASWSSGAPRWRRRRRCRWGIRAPAASAHRPDQ
ncbi:maltokinase N-terminal cap-like domain-containing protein [Agromyces flavus]|uniref:Maltokinase n=1 Tax=Agromyces flavus TaxID=589382 RepID=A0A1H2A5P9_9MICO|nr:phosphotransferase [Agromyces flavus]SDT41308.1 Predicted trehalose synthase [Agromyces flavus]